MHRYEDDDLRAHATVRRRVEGDEGVTALEYAFIAALIAVVIVGGVQSLGLAVNGVFDDVQQFFAKH